MPAPSRILIVGGGIAGLALARALREQGSVPEIIERAVSWPAGGTGLYLPGNGVRALGALGLGDKVLARAVCMSHQRMLDHRGRQLAEIELAKLWNPVGLCVGIARGEQFCPRGDAFACRHLSLQCGSHRHLESGSEEKDSR